MSQTPFATIGQSATIDDDVTLGYRYPNCKNPLVIGDHAIIRSGSILYADTTIGHHFSCGHQALIRAEVTIGDRVVVYHKCTLEGRIRIGSGVKIMAHVYIPSRTTIGDFVFIGPGTIFLNDRFPMRGKGSVQGATLGNHVTIGGNVTVCPGITIGNNCLIGAGAVVTKDIPDNTLAYGSPARFHPLPDDLKNGNLPQLILPQTDIWGPYADDSWPNDPLADTLAGD